MAPAFSKEAILQGSIDHLCLVCESYLRTERDVCLHVATAAHKRNFDNTNYVEKYRNDRIRKVKKWYFCEFCNVLVSTITKVRLHVEDPGHRENVTSQMIARLDDGIVFGNIVIFDEAWHGFIDEFTCTICNVEFENKDEHRSESAHIVNLIQSKVNTSFNNIYRKIDDSTFHCLTCNTVVVGINSHLDETKHKNLIQNCIKIKTSMPVTEAKIRNYEGKCSPQAINEVNRIDEKNNFPGKITLGTKTSKELTANLNIDEVVTDRETKKTLGGMEDQSILKTNKNLCEKPNAASAKDNTSDILDSISKFQKENITINLESRTVVCKRCLVILVFDSNAIDKHIIEAHNNNEQIKSNGVKSTVFEMIKESKPKNNETLFTSPVFRNHENKNKENVSTKTKENTKDNHDDVIQKMAEEHNLTYTDNKLSCQKCNKCIPLSVRNINEHVNGELHKNNNKTSSKPTHSKDIENKKVTTKKYNLQKVPIQQFVKMITTVKNMFAEDVVINQKYCINLLAFTFLTMTAPGRLRCQVCEVNLRLQDLKEHLDIKRHERAMNEVPVIIHTGSEFIREIRSGIFQCGFCNIIDSWEGMENHLKSTDHKESKTFANWRLSQHLPEIERHNRERQIHNEFLMRLMFS